VLDLGRAVPDTRINCENGCWRYRHRTLHDHHPYGILPVSDVIVHSSNIGAAKLGLLLGPQRLARVVELYHFGEEYGVRLPAEEPGIVTRRDRWTYYTTTSVPMGQEIAGTPLQLIAGFCSLINGGRLMEPFIVAAVENPNSGDVTRRTPIEVRRVIRPATSATMRRILAQVVERGTGRRLREARYPIGGKTGTAQKRAAAGGYSHDKFVASFIGFAPVDEPKLCVLVMADEPQGAHYGGTVAAPAVGRIIDSSLALLEAAPPSESGPVVAVRETDSR
jgi:cell division protein FtsI (penicillin-binding protein 3)